MSSYRQFATWQAWQLALDTKQGSIVVPQHEKLVMSWYAWTVAQTQFRLKFQAYFVPGACFEGPVMACAHCCGSMMHAGVAPHKGGFVMQVNLWIHQKCKNRIRTSISIRNMSLVPVTTLTLRFPPDRVSLKTRRSQIIKTTTGLFFYNIDTKWSCDINFTIEMHEHTFCDSMDREKK